MTKLIKNGFWNGPTWLKDDCRNTTRKFASAEQARAAAHRAYDKAKARGEQLQDRWYLVSGGESNVLFLD